MANAPQLRPLGETLGTEALGIDLSKPLDEATFAWIERPSPNTRCWCSATRISGPPNSPRSAAGSARRACTRWSSTVMPNIRRCPG